MENDQSSCVNSLDRNCVVEKQKCGKLVAIQASIVNSITFDYNQWMAGFC